MTTYLHRYAFDVWFMGIYLIVLAVVITSWIFFVNRNARMKLRERVMGLVQEVDPKCRIQPKRNSSKHVCFFLTMSPPATAIELYFDGGRNRFELFDSRSRTSLDRKTIGDGIELNVPSISSWIISTLYPGIASETPPA